MLQHSSPRKERFSHSGAVHVPHHGQDAAKQVVGEHVDGCQPAAGRRERLASRAPAGPHAREMGLLSCALNSKPRPVGVAIGSRSDVSKSKCPAVCTAAEAAEQQGCLQGGSSAIVKVLRRLLASSSCFRLSQGLCPHALRRVGQEQNNRALLEGCGKIVAGDRKHASENNCMPSAKSALEGLAAERSASRALHHRRRLSHGAVAAHCPFPLVTGLHCAYDAISKVVR